MKKGESDFERHALKVSLMGGVADRFAHGGIHTFSRRKTLIEDQ